MSPIDKTNTKPVQIKKVNNLLEYTLTADNQPEDIYTNGQPVLRATAEADALATSIGWQVIHAWAQLVGDKTTEYAAIELYNDAGSGIPTDAETGMDFMQPFDEILAYINKKLVDKGYDQGTLDKAANNKSNQDAALGL